jgi:UDP-N-acetylmuramoyl-tripeptide--D-alanyl-D-alanine ligase
MKALWEALPAGRRGGYAEESSALEPQVLSAIRPGDAVMVKGSLGSRMGPIVKALQRLSARQNMSETGASGNATLQAASAQG